MSDDPRSPDYGWYGVLCNAVADADVFGHFSAYEVEGIAVVCAATVKNLLRVAAPDTEGEGT